MICSLHPFYHPTEFCLPKLVGKTKPFFLPFKQARTYGGSVRVGENKPTNLRWLSACAIHSAGTKPIRLEGVSKSAYASTGKLVV